MPWLSLPSRLAQKWRWQFINIRAAHMRFPNLSWGQYLAAFRVRGGFAAHAVIFSQEIAAVVSSGTCSTYAA